MRKPLMMMRTKGLTGPAFAQHAGTNKLTKSTGNTVSGGSDAVCTLQIDGTNYFEKMNLVGVDSEANVTYKLTNIEGPMPNQYRIYWLYVGQDADNYVRVYNSTRSRYQVLCVINGVQVINQEMTGPSSQIPGTQIRIEIDRYINESVPRIEVRIYHDNVQQFQTVTIDDAGADFAINQVYTTTYDPYQGVSKILQPDSLVVEGYDSWDFSSGDNISEPSIGNPSDSAYDITYFNVTSEDWECV